MLHLPQSDSPLRELFDVAALAALTFANVPTFGQLRASAARMFAAEGSALVAVNGVCLRADGTLELVRFGSKGGARTLWRFGQFTNSAVAA